MGNPGLFHLSSRVYAEEWRKLHLLFVSCYLESSHNYISGSHFSNKVSSSWIHPASVSWILPKQSTTVRLNKLILGFFIGYWTVGGEGIGWYSRLLFMLTYYLGWVWWWRAGRRPWNINIYANTCRFGGNPLHVPPVGCQRANNAIALRDVPKFMNSAPLLPSSYEFLSSSHKYSRQTDLSKRTIPILYPPDDDEICVTQRFNHLTYNTQSQSVFSHHHDDGPCLQSYLLANIL